MRKHSNYFIFINIFLVIFLMTGFFDVLKLVPNIVNSIWNINNNNLPEDSINELVAHAEMLIPEDSIYIFLDSDETGFLNFYKLRYFLAPRKSIHFNSYYYYINHVDMQEMFNKLSELEYDYVIVRENIIIESEFKLDIDSDKGFIFKRSYLDAKTFRELLIPLEEIE